jgi:aspartyl-tRNA(Asn)/glutamyl-tRNA(Gln) amidotransferase subunit C
MTITKEAVKKIAHLARIAVDEKDLTAHAEKLTSIFTLIQELEKYDTKNIQPLANPLSGKQPFRPDIVTETDQREAFLELAPEKAAGLFLVPQVIE